MNRRELVGKLLLGVTGFYSIKASAEASRNNNQVGFIKNSVMGMAGNINGQVTLTPEMFVSSDVKKNDSKIEHEQYDFYSAFSLMFLKAHELSENNIVNIKLEKEYKLSRASFELPSNCHVYGRGLVYLNSDSDSEFIFRASGKRNFSIEDLILSSSKVDKLWSKSASGILIEKCTGFTISNVNISFRTDAIAITNSHAFRVMHCSLHDLGEEGIVVRSSSRWIIFDNHIYNHNGDGILLKTGGLDSRDGKVIFNRIHGGSDRYGLKGTNGGGITLNDEVKGSSTYFHNLLVEGNTIENTSYGISFTNIENLKVVENNITAVQRFGIVIDNSVYNNPQKHPSNKTLVSGNSVQHTQQAGISFTSLNGVDVGNTIISQNFVSDCALKENADFPGISANLATVVNNRVSNCRTLLSAKDCIIDGNKFSDSFKTKSGKNSAVLKLIGKTVFSSNIISDKNMGHIRLGDVSGSVFCNNIITMSSDFAVFHSESDFSDNIIFKNNSITYKSATIFKLNPTSESYISTDLDTLGNKTTYFGMPTKGQFKKGDRAFDTNPCLGMPTEWVCVESGNPGRWQIDKFFNLIVRSSLYKVVIPPNSFDELVISDTRVNGDFIIESIMSSMGGEGCFYVASVRGDGKVVVKISNVSNQPLSINTIFTIVLNNGY
ncbi:right-handed parallel beta-helix repeat-containing protein [Serratia proteamaculans]|uniref:Right-handed parallel beta-helix repeat-containing protein n=1 Tax=Serratia proteamaculans TaxID=28151 RepID=A0ABS0TZ83_SERPR|nr:right-handed parallel beta-helix repeat-containing protein [Serratia proteamaculans]MBI6183619.1 right-handed parallel beta-helix repeat-containing protein [Serratia proteamaculans]